jgi:hypothetical protein
MKLRAILFTSLLVAACGKSKSSSSTDDPPPPKTADPAATKPPEPKAEPAPPIAAPKGLFGCHAKDPAATSAKRKPASPWQLPFTFAGCPSIPSEIFGTADFGMEGEAAAAAAKAKLSGESAYIYLGKVPFRYQFTFRLDEAVHKVEKFTFKIDQEAFDEMKAAWGEPVVYTRLSDKNLAWYNPEKHLKVIAQADEWDRANVKTKEDEKVPGYRLYFTRYIPLAEVVGKDGIVAKPIIGKTVAELAAAFPEWIEVKSKAENKADMDKMGLDQGTQAKVQALGGAGDTAMLQMPESETNDYHTLVQPDWEGGKVASYTMLLPFGKDQELKAEILATVAAALGAPTGAKKDGDKWEYTFAGPNGTIVEMGMSILEEDWNMRISPKK